MKYMSRYIIHPVSKFYAKFNSIFFLKKKPKGGDCSVTYSLSFLLYGCAFWQLNDTSMHKVSVAEQLLLKNLLHCSTCAPHSHVIPHLST